MLFRLILFLLIVGGLLAAWKTGMLESLRSGGVPEEDRECIIMGPVPGQGVPVAADPAVLEKEMDAHVGGVASEQIGALTGIKDLYESGELTKIPDQSKVRVIENGALKIQNIPHKIVKVRFLDGEFKGGAGWIERDNLLDTPLQALFQSMRSSGKGEPSKAPNAE